MYINGSDEKILSDIITVISNNHPTVSARQFVELPREIRTDSAISLKRKRSYKNLHLSVKYISITMTRMYVRITHFYFTTFFKSKDLVEDPD